MDLLIIAVLGILAIAAASQLSDRIGVAPALILLAGGTAVGFLPFIPAIELDPQVVLEGVLPPLLFSTAVSISTINFRRELAPVAVLAILLVALSAAVIGVALALVVPGLSLAWAIAMGAILSPTDAVAISIARRLGVSQRIITVLEGEGLLNDATALVLLSSAVSAATSGGISIGGVLGGFALAVLVALGVGWLVGEVSLRVRSHITDPTVDTVVSFTVPFLAAIPAEHMHGSGLVAAVVAGLITGHRGPRMLPPAHRVASRTNWHTVELTLEGLIFLFMGLEFFGIVEKVDASDLGVRRAVGVAVLAGALTVVVRALVVAPMLKLLSHRTARWAVHWEENEEAIQQFQNAARPLCAVRRKCLRSRGTAAASSRSSASSVETPATRASRGAPAGSPAGPDVEGLTWTTSPQIPCVPVRAPSSSGRVCAAPSPWLRPRLYRPRRRTGPSSSWWPCWWRPAP